MWPKVAYTYNPHKLLLAQSPTRGPQEELRHRVSNGGSGGVEGIVPHRKQGEGMALDDGLHSDVEVAEHLITLPPPDETDGVGVNVSKQEGHGTSCVEGPGGDVGSYDSNGLAYVVTGVASRHSEFGAGDAAPPPSRVPDAEQRIGWGAVSAHVLDM